VADNILVVEASDTVVVSAEGARTNVLLLVRDASVTVVLSVDGTLIAEVILVAVPAETVVESAEGNLLAVSILVVDASDTVIFSAVGERLNCVPAVTSPKANHDTIRSVVSATLQLIVIVLAENDVKSACA